MRLSFLFFLVSLLSTAQNPQVSSGAIKTSYGYDYLVTNREAVPISVKLSGRLKNLRSSTNLEQIFVVPARAINFKIAAFQIVQNGTYGYDLTTSYLWGDQSSFSYDRNFDYHLPYARSAAWLVSQGYNGNSTHKNTFAIDFTMPVGTPVHAARSGVVIMVKENESEGCTAPKCLEKANYIRVLHQDGTIAVYNHLKKNGSIVKKGDYVQQDQHIGYSGNTGWTTGPHLHFSVYQPRFGKKGRTLPVRFRTGSNSYSDYLKESYSYRKP